jgi:hypothetical protein
MSARLLGLVALCATLGARVEAYAQEAAPPPWRRPPRAAAAAPVDEGVADFNADAAGRVTVFLESAGVPQRVVLELRRTDSSTWTPRAPPNLLGAGTCTTPCALHVPPGVLMLRAEGAGLRGTDARLTAPAFDARVRLRAGSQPWWNVGVGMVALGATMLVAIAGLGLAAQRDDGTPLSTATLLGVGAGAGVLLGVGVPLMVFNRTGVDRMAPLTAAP